MARRPVGSSIEVMVNPLDHGEGYVVERERAIAFATVSVFMMFFLVFFFIAFD